MDTAGYQLVSGVSSGKYMTTAKPVVKWAGGKKQLLAQIRCRLPKTMETYFEPFIGGGAVFFALANRKAFKRAVINDMNKELMDTYLALATGKVKDVIDILIDYPNNRDFYNEIRARNPVEIPEIELRVARFIYLNKTGFNGLYRINQSGGFNTPFGKYPNPNICDAAGLQEAARALQGVTIECRDYALSIESAKPGDVIYFDPPYLPVSETANFTSYTEDGFGLVEHERLARIFHEVADRGVSVLLSNANVKRARDLYAGCRLSRVQARRNINSAGDKRGVVGELLVGANLPRMSSL
jgi:DNA adenine methylase